MLSTLSTQGSRRTELFGEHVEFSDRIYRLWGLFVDRRFGIGRWEPDIPAGGAWRSSCWRRAVALQRLVLGIDHRPGSDSDIRGNHDDGLVVLRQDAGGRPTPYGPSPDPAGPSRSRSADSGGDSRSGCLWRGDNRRAWRTRHTRARSSLLSPRSIWAICPSRVLRGYSRTTVRGPVRDVGADRVLARVGGHVLACRSRDHSCPLSVPVEQCSADVVPEVADDMQNVSEITF